MDQRDEPRREGLQVLVPHIGWMLRTVEALEPEPLRRRAQIVIAVAHACRELEQGTLASRSLALEEHLVTLLVDAVRTIHIELPDDAGEEANDVAQAVHRLPFAQRVAYVLHAQLRHSTRTIARALEITEREVESLLVEVECRLSK